MNGFKKALTATIFFLGITSQAQAATQYTAPVTIVGSDKLVCSLANVGYKPAEVQVYVLGLNGVQLATTGLITLGEGTVTTASAGINLFTPAYCMFTFGTSKKNVRASGCVTHTGTSCDALIQAQ